MNNGTADILLALFRDRLRKKYFRYTDTRNHLAVDQDFVQVITSEQSQFNKVRDLLDLLNGE